MKRKDRLLAVAMQRHAVLQYCRDLTEEQWQTPSCADGWTVRDVVSHLGSSCKAIATPQAISVLRTSDIERENDIMVEPWRRLSSEQVLNGFARWSKVLLRILTISTATPLVGVRVPLGNLGRYPLRLYPSAAVFDWYTHLHHDIAPALGRPAASSSEREMSVLVEWMLAGMSQMNRATMGWVDRPVALTLTGPGGGSWSISPAGDGRLNVAEGAPPEVVAHVTGSSLEFPAWATARQKWRDTDVTIAGDEKYAARFLNALNIV